MKKIMLLLCLVACFSPAYSWAGKTLRVVVFADSVMGGYQLQPQDSFAAKLQKKILASGYDKAEVINMSKLDATTAVATEDAINVAPHLPDVIIVQLGFVDARRGVIPTATSFNLHTILTELKKTNAYIILVGTSPPPGAEPAYVEAFATMYHDLATKHTIPLYPNAMEGISEQPSMTLADGLHPNTAGIEYMVEALYPLVDTGLRWRYENHAQDLVEKHGFSNTTAQ